MGVDCGETSQDTIQSNLKRFGQIINVRLLERSEGAYVTFKFSESADNAVTASDEGETKWNIGRKKGEVNTKVERRNVEEKSEDLPETSRRRRRERSSEEGDRRRGRRRSRSRSRSRYRGRSTRRRERHRRSRSRSRCRSRRSERRRWRSRSSSR